MSGIGGSRYACDETTGEGIVATIAGWQDRAMYTDTYPADDVPDALKREADSVELGLPVAPTGRTLTR